MDLKKALPLIDKVISRLTVRRVVALATMALVCIVSLTFWEHRSAITDIFTGTAAIASVETKINLHDDTKKRIEDLVKRNADISTVMMFYANIRVNQRDIVYYFSDDAAIDVTIKQFLATRGTSTPIFTSDEKNNAQMVSVVNGEFGCYKYDDGNIGLKLADRVAAVCRASLPPYYGEFSGYISFFLVRMPDESLTNEIRIEAQRLATEIYYKSIKGKKL